MEDKLVNAVVTIATTLNKLEQEGLFQPDPAQAREVVFALRKIAVTLDKIEGHLSNIEGYLLGRP